MKAEIITIGDEILIGQIVDTNSAFIAKELNKIGVSVCQITSIQDEKKHILITLKEAEARADIIIITGGLGPTKDDITKHTICEYFNDTLVQNDAVLAHITELFKNSEHKILTKTNVQQALMPSKAIVLHNENGTAAGMYFNKGNKAFISLPGVPYEMEALIKDKVIPKLVSEYDTPHIYHKTVITQGVAESVLAEQISEWEDDLPEFIRLAYLPSLGIVKLRLSAIGVDKKKIEAAVANEIEGLLSQIKDVVIGFDEDSPEIAIANLLIEKKQTLAVAESCTGGIIASSITQNEGVSAFFKGAVVTYHTSSKSGILDIDQRIIQEYSVVSEAVVKAMVLSVKNKFDSDYAIATTGNAGPKKGDAAAEIGTVFIAIATPEKVVVEEFNFGKNRFKVIQRAKNKALQLLRKEILNAK
ncbi:MAG: CinA family nicotinamide mononucleotide deamidase-related protein [Flavobacteriaceae bacterium]|nr:CinA family nicotinamide mononucleotide deamidase-related protein [Flavobacteriaceae bacterium]